MLQEYQAGDCPDPNKSWELSEFMGRGSFGEVWKAKSTSSGKRCAIKIISNLHQRGGQKEFRSLQIVKDINHPNLVPIFDFWLKDSKGNHIPIPDQFELKASTTESAERNLTGTLHPSSPLSPSQRKTSAFDAVEQLSRNTSSERVASELIIAMGIGDQSLEDRLAECKAEGLAGIPAGELLRYLEGAAKAIDELNGREIQHCDIKPGNILIVGREAQVCDFGLAQAVGPDIRATMHPAFSPAYADPAQEDGKPAKSTDLYCLAATYVELKTGALPFSIENHQKLRESKRQGQLLLDGLDDSEQGLVRSALAPNPDDRLFSSCSAFVQELKDSLDAPPEAPPTQQRRKNSRLFWAIPTVAIIALIAGFVANRMTPNQSVEDTIARLMQRKEFKSAYTELAHVDDATRDTMANSVCEQWYKHIAAQNQKLGDLKSLTIAQDMLRTRRPNDHAEQAFGKVREFRRQLVARLIAKVFEADHQNNGPGVRQAAKQLLTTYASIEREPDLEEIDSAWLLWTLHADPNEPDADKMLSSRTEWLDLREGGNSISLDLLTAHLNASHDSLKNDNFNQKHLSALERAFEQRESMADWQSNVFKQEVISFENEYVQREEQKKLTEESRAIALRILSGRVQPALAWARRFIVTGRFDEAAAKISAAANIDGDDSEPRIKCHRALLTLVNPANDFDTIASELDAVGPPQLIKLIEGLGDTAFRAFAFAVLHYCEKPRDLDRAAEYAYSALKLNDESNDIHPLQLQRCAEILVNRADELWRVDSNDASRQFYSQSHAKTALTQLASVLAVNHKFNLTLATQQSLYLNLALAAYYTVPQDLEGVIQYSNAYLKSNPNRTPLSIHLVRAEAYKQNKDVENSIKSYAAAIRHWIEVSDFNSNEFSNRRRAMYIAVVVPAMPLVESMNSIELESSLKSSLATIWAFRGEVLRRDYSVRNKIDSPEKEAYESYSKAVQLEEKTEYLVGQGHTLIEFSQGIAPEKTVQELLEILKRAFANAKKNAENMLPLYKLAGYTNILMSLTTVEIVKKVSALEKAKLFLDKAIDDEKGKQDAELFTNRCTAQVAIAFHMPKFTQQDRDEARQILDSAVEDAKIAIDLAKDQQNQVLARMAKGNALEDLEFYMQIPKQFEGAVQEFKAAQNIALISEPEVALGRCLFRYGATLRNGDSKERLRAAIKILATEPNGEGKLLAARRKFWLGKTYEAFALLDDRNGSDYNEKAANCFDRAERLAKKFDKIEWADFALARADFELRVRNNRKAALRLAMLVVDTFFATTDLPVGESQLIRAVRFVVDNSSQEDRDEMFRLVSKWLNQFQSNSGIHARIELSVIRIELGISLNKFNAISLNSKIELAEKLISNLFERNNHIALLKDEAIRWQNEYRSRIAYAKAIDFLHAGEFAAARAELKKAIDLTADDFNLYCQDQYEFARLSRNLDTYVNAVTGYGRTQIKLNANDAEASEAVELLKSLSTECIQSIMSNLQKRDVADTTARLKQ